MRIAVRSRLKILSLASDRPTATSRQTRLRFVMNHRVRFGSTIAVVGGSSSLGNWKPDASLPLEWQDGDSWVGETRVPAG